MEGEARGKERHAGLVLIRVWRAVDDFYGECSLSLSGGWELSRRRSADAWAPVIAAVNAGRLSKVSYKV